MDGRFKKLKAEDNGTGSRHCRVGGEAAGALS
jgi:hypothetical protein